MRQNGKFTTIFLINTRQNAQKGHERNDKVHDRNDMQIKARLERFKNLGTIGTKSGNENKARLERNKARKGQYLEALCPGNGRHDTPCLLCQKCGVLTAFRNSFYYYCALVTFMRFKMEM